MIRIHLIACYTHVTGNLGVDRWSYYVTNVVSAGGA